MLTRLVATGFVSVLATSSNGCFKSCTDEYVYPSYRVTVADEATGDLICDADVTMGPGTPARKSPVDCSYVLDIPRPTAPPGMVTIFADKPGYAPASKEVSTTHDADDCGHAIAKPVKLALTPE